MIFGVHILCELNNKGFFFGGGGSFLMEQLWIFLI